ncbi:MAG: hypothetical protein QOD99_2646 [Chthoniobacter sp.]|jgi:mono/diheme cytochrome c family protein|nr:hypothetical protein [Chthoniobacter sp.]
MLRVFFLFFVLAVITVVAVAGFRGTHSTKTPIEIIPDMDRQPRFDPQHESAFFNDGRAARRPVEGTVPLGYVLQNAYYSTGGSNNKFAKAPGAFSDAPDYFNTGKIGDAYGDGLPLEASMELMQRGRERFTVNCAICHGATGAGNGIVSQYGLVGVANFQDARLRAMPDGQIFNTITNGKNTMGAYGSNVTVEDRWAIIAYIRALQQMQNSKVADVPENLRAQLDQPPPQEPAKK